ncbi:MAG: DUF4127 family protein [Selenomonadaceae bacterium]
MKNFFPALFPVILVLLIIGAYHASNRDFATALRPCSIERGSTLSGQKILLVPLDSRPPCSDFVTKAAAIVGDDVVMPPSDIMDYYSKPSETEKIKSWANDNISSCDVAIISIDQILYGGLLASRELEKSSADIAGVVDFLTELHRKYPEKPLYIFTILPRFAPPDSIDTSSDRKNLMQYSRLVDKTEQSLNPDDEDIAKLNDLRQTIPPKILSRYESLFTFHEALTKHLIELAENGTVTQLVIGLDDGEKYGMPNRERRNLENYIGQAKNKSSVFMMHGADEIALSIVAEMEAKRCSYTPSIFIDYNDESTAARIMPYMATTNEANAIEKINFIHGARVASRGDADFTLFISANDYESDTMNTRRANATRIKNLLDAGKSIALVDLAVHFREEETLLPLLIDEDAPIHRLAAYAGWNTASNSIGTALAEAVLFDIAKKRAATTNELIGASDKQLLFLDERFIEDCYYLKSTIDTINFSLRKEGYYDVNDLDLDHNTHWANDMLSKALKRRIDFLTSSRAYNMPMICTTPSGETLKFTVKNLKADAYFPWPRTFEIRLTTKHDLMTE